MRAILSGGGDEQQSRAVDEFFFRIIPQDKPLLYIPVATPQENGGSDACKAWFTRLLSLHGERPFDMWMSLAGKSYADLVKYGAVYIGGGNTFALLRNLREHGTVELLKLYLSKGGIVYGSSAGALILSASIAPATLGAYADTNDSGLTVLNGLCILGKYSVHCHFAEADREAVRAMVRTHRMPIIAIPESSAVYVEDKALMAVGTEPLEVFELDGNVRTVRPGARVR